MDLREIQNIFEKELSAQFPVEWKIFFHTSIFEIDGFNLKDIVLNESSLNASKYLEIIERLKSQEPIQYIFGKAPFLGFELTLNENVLIPRSETEELVLWMVDTLGTDFRGSIVDIGVGSGCIGIGLKIMLPQSSVQGFDVSDGALKCATDNVDRLNVDVFFNKLDVLTSDLPKADVYVSNPPYIGLDEIDTVGENVLKHEPHLALFSDGDALLFYKRILSIAYNKKVEQVFFEINPIYKNELAELCQFYGYSSEFKQDRYGKFRMLCCELLNL